MSHLLAAALSIVEVDLKDSDGGYVSVATMSKQAGSKFKLWLFIAFKSSIAKLRMVVRLAEAWLKHVEQKQFLGFNTQQVVSQATAVAEVRTKAKTKQESEEVSSVLD